MISYQILRSHGNKPDDIERYARQLISDHSREWILENERLQREAMEIRVKRFSVSGKLIEPDDSDTPGSVID